jgi:predicted O-methyltransferase YrrM
VSTFTTDWFTHNIDHWQAAVKPPTRPIRQALELGVFEGRSVCWMLDHLDVEHITAVDWWDHEWLEHRGHHNTEAIFDANIAPYGERVTKVKASTFDFLKANTDTFDLIYIDGGHQGKTVITDAVLAHHALRPNGLLIFDDYGQDKDPKRIDRARGAIDHFMELFADHYEPIHVGYQVMLRKLG